MCASAPINIKIHVFAGKYALAVPSKKNMRKLELFCVEKVLPKTVTIWYNKTNNV